MERLNICLLVIKVNYEPTVIFPSRGSLYSWPERKIPLSSKNCYGSDCLYRIC